MATVQIPAPSSTLATNLLGVSSLAAIVVAIGALTSWPWALLTAGAFGIALTVLAQLDARQQPTAAVTQISDARARRGEAAA